MKFINSAHPQNLLQLETRDGFFSKGNCQFFILVFTTVLSFALSSDKIYACLSIQEYFEKVLTETERHFSSNEWKKNGAWFRKVKHPSLCRSSEWQTLKIVDQVRKHQRHSKDHSIEKIKSSSTGAKIYMIKNREKVVSYLKVWKEGNSEVYHSLVAELVRRQNLKSSPIGFSRLLGIYQSENAKDTKAYWAILYEAVPGLHANAKRKDISIEKTLFRNLAKFQNYAAVRISELPKTISDEVESLKNYSTHKINLKDTLNAYIRPESRKAVFEKTQRTIDDYNSWQPRWSVIAHGDAHYGNWTIKDDCVYSLDFSSLYWSIKPHKSKYYGIQTLLKDYSRLSLASLNSCSKIKGCSITNYLQPLQKTYTNELSRTNAQVHENVFNFYILEYISNRMNKWMENDLHANACLYIGYYLVRNKMEIKDYLSKQCEDSIQRHTSLFESPK